MGRVSGLCVMTRIASGPTNQMNDAELALDCKVALGLATPVNPTVGHTTRSIHTGDAFNPTP